MTDRQILLLLLLALLGFAACLPGEQVEVTIPAGSTTIAIADSLYSKGVIPEPVVFRIIARVLGYDRRLRHGRFTLHRNQDYLSVLEALSRSGKTAVTVTIPEGFSLREIAELLDRHEVCSRDDFMDAGYDRELLSSLGIPGSNAEGYLFPDTWKFETDTPAAQIITRLVQRFFVIWAREYAKVNQPPLDDRSTVILASIVEKEAVRPEEARLIAGVFLNRLERGMLLQSCATVQYVLPFHRETLTWADIRVESPYNTYLHEGLTPGPICNPGARALAAALNPEPTEYLYFVSRGDGSHVFSQTLAEHLRAQRRINTGR